MKAVNVESELEIKKIIDELSAQIHSEVGIQLGDKQYVMIESRLRSHMLKLSIPTFSEYLKFFKSNIASEKIKLISLLTTHHTYFFREFGHFEFILDELPRIVAKKKSQGVRLIKIWSAACSKGQEVYSLAMFMDFHLKSIAPDFSFEIYGTDVDPESVQWAKNGVYAWDEVKKIPIQYLDKNWVRGTGNISNFAKIKDELKSKCKFEVDNLIQLKQGKPTFDFIFCRNVFIYFKPSQISQISNMLMSHLEKEGYFFIGISETLNGIYDSVKYVGTSVYQHKAVHEFKADKAVNTSTQPIASNAKPPIQEKKPAGPIRVLCVDDSSTILTLLKKILSKETGFEVVGTAMNGIEADKLVKQLKPDVLTLDIHMPEMDGVQYLQKHFNSAHPAVVMLSSINRENAEMAIKSIELGASDYIEKPTMSDLAERSDEIRFKLKLAIKAKGQSRPRATDVEKSFVKSFVIPEPNKKARWIMTSLSKAHLHQLESLFSQIKESDPVTLIPVDGAVVFEGYTKKWPDYLKNKISNQVKLGKIIFVDMANLDDAYLKQFEGVKSSLMVLGNPTKKMISAIHKIHPEFLVLEDLGLETKDKFYLELKEVAQSIIPITSYLSVSEEYFVNSNPKKGAA